jgi:hypothetical protein
MRRSPILLDLYVASRDGPAAEAWCVDNGLGHHTFGPMYSNRFRQEVYMIRFVCWDTSQAILAKLTWGGL